MNRLSRMWVPLTGIAIAVLVVLVVASLPLIFLSMQRDLTGENDAARYNLATGEPVDNPNAVPTGTDPANITILLEGLDESTQQVRLMVVGRRYCAPPCDPLSMVLYALPAPGDTLTIPSSVPVTLPVDDQPFDVTVNLPVRGRPQAFPIDHYQLLLGVSVRFTNADGLTLPLTSDQLAQRGIVILSEEVIPRFVVTDRPPVDTLSVREDLGDLGISFLSSITFRRPIYLRLESALLVLLFAMAGIISVLRQDIDELLIGVGSLILGMWGIRAILVQTNYGGITLIDVFFSLFAILILLGCLVRIALQMRAKRRTDPNTSASAP